MNAGKQDLNKKIRLTRRLSLIPQAEESECGLACLAMIATHYRTNIDIHGLRRAFPTSRSGLTLKGLISNAEKIGFGVRALRVSVDELENVKTPAIIHWDFNHFVVLASVKVGSRGKHYRILDPAKGDRRLTRSEVEQSFTGIALELWADKSFQRSNKAHALKTRQLWSSVDGLWGNLGLVLVLSVISQIISLTLPFYLQVGIDSAVPSKDVRFLATLGAGFLGVALISVVANWLRALTVANFHTSFQFQIINNLFRKMLSLPVTWFSKRHVGDIVSRFSSTSPIVDFIGSSLPTIVLDVFIVSATCTLMALYSPFLCAVCVSLWVVFIAVRWTSIVAVKSANIDLVNTGAKETSTFIENVRGYLTIKAFAKEDERRHLWQDVKAASLRAQLGLTRIASLFEALTSTILSLEQVLVSFLAVWLAIKGEFTIGMVFAFQSYRQQFAEASTRLTEQVYKYRLLAVHLDRVSDIALATSEDNGVRNESNASFDGKISLRNVSFKYGSSEKPVLTNVNIEIRPGESLVLVGPSGGGKTTLIKIMMGLLTPTSGSVFIDDINLEYVGPARWREKTGSLLQEDTLFAGTLAENISFFEHRPNRDRLLAACSQADIIEYVENHPLGLELTVGDMGSSLSGGQKQRVMLARALYTNPVALFMDEGTANLDPLSEQKIVKTISSLKMTKVISAHRPAAIETADRVLLVTNGQVVELKSQGPNAQEREKNVSINAEAR